MTGIEAIEALHQIKGVDGNETIHALVDVLIQYIEGTLTRSAEDSKQTVAKK